jgi:hypothetical protein
MKSRTSISCRQAPSSFFLPQKSVFRALSKEVRDTCGIKGNVSVPPAGILQLMLLLILIYTACHNNVPKKGWRHKCCSKKTFCNRNVFLTTTIMLKSFCEAFCIASHIRSPLSIQPRHNHNPLHRIILDNNILLH